MIDNVRQDWTGVLLTSTARRKWQELQKEGAQFTRMAYFFNHPTKGFGQIDDFGKVTWHNAPRSTE